MASTALTVQNKAEAGRARAGPGMAGRGRKVTGCVASVLWMGGGSLSSNASTQRRLAGPAAGHTRAQRRGSAQACRHWAESRLGSTGGGSMGDELAEAVVGEPKPLHPQPMPTPISMRASTGLSQPESAVRSPTSAPCAAPTARSAQRRGGHELRGVQHQGARVPGGRGRPRVRAAVRGHRQLGPQALPEGAVWALSV